MKKIMKKIFPKVIKNLIIKYINNQIIKNHFKKNHSKNALFSYILTPFKKDSLSHTNFYEAQSWAKILDELGYNVDIIDFGNTKTIDLSKYDLICGFGDVFQHYFENTTSNKAITIHYGTGRHLCYVNNASLERIKNVFDRKGVWLAKSARLIEKAWAHQTALVDGIIALGNEVCADSYRKYFTGSVYSLPAPFYKTIDAETIIKQKTEESKKHYLWFGSSGLVHKGLDLCLEYFAKNQDIYLHVCGPIENESDFVTAYNKELFETPNIQVYGFVDITSKEFESILSLCSFIVFPSCSEGGSPSTLTVIGNGGLIPIITKETTISTGYEIWIDGFDYNSIDIAIKQSKALTFDEIIKIQYKNYKFVIENNSKDKYFAVLRKNIEDIIKNKTKKRKCMISKIRKFIKKINSYDERFNKIELALGRIETRQNKSANLNCINDYEFKVFSQWGEDGIIQYLVNNIAIENKIFVEFGVENYTESNTRFLLQNNNWSGLVIDGSQEHIQYIKNDPIYWKHNLKAECAFITKDNINELITKNGIKGDIGILSVDIDGNDYWVWQAINCISPRIVICEYNAIFGDTEKISVPYKQNFVWTNEHYSNLYWGASLPAFEYLGKKKGYTLIGCNTNGINAFFVRNDLVGDITTKSAKEAYNPTSVRQSRNEKKELTYLTNNDSLYLLKDCIVSKVDTLKATTIKELFGL